jgi:hypothetical protein
MYVVIQHASCSLRQPIITDTFQCLETIVDTLRKVNPREGSRGTLHCLQSNILYVMSSIQYSSRWPAESKEILLPYLGQGQRHLQEIIELDVRSEKYFYLHEKCIIALINAIERWKSLISVYSIALMLEEQVPALYHLE